jgi:hypothetical protein
MVAQLNHTIVAARDKHESAAFLSEILGLPRNRGFAIPFAFWFELWHADRPIASKTAHAAALAQPRMKAVMDRRGRNRNMRAYLAANILRRAGVALHRCAVRIRGAHIQLAFALGAPRRCHTAPREIAVDDLHLSRTAGRRFRGHALLTAAGNGEQT